MDYDPNMVTGRFLADILRLWRKRCPNSKKLFKRLTNDRIDKKKIIEPLEYFSVTKSIYKLYNTIFYYFENFNNSLKRQEKHQITLFTIG